MDLQNLPKNPHMELIEVAEESDRKYWADRLGVSCETLKSAIRAIRNMEFSKVQQYLTSNNLNKTPFKESFI
ncbi:DUF3606 domain-containing protein [Pedobacter punctiformis]|uniref:DUF3606 domain-containing protein n=1 Tax=Pedobacter punctiformis TaxID=3004097 RepID=A0ABT4LB85_9SPHI|nr:DUF3606 domain-containing protein [Pedobacter sp. HCMS5-2]MCZ4244064.1 DUF3606 domain-containing protein [Pedobacter sp. HCMS5-2]